MRAVLERALPGVRALSGHRRGDPARGRLGRRRHRRPGLPLVPGRRGARRDPPRPAARAAASASSGTSATRASAGWRGSRRSWSRIAATRPPPHRRLARGVRADDALRAARPRGGPARPPADAGRRRRPRRVGQLHRRASRSPSASGPRRGPRAPGHGPRDARPRPRSSSRTGPTSSGLAPLALAAPDDLQAPGLAAREELVRVDLAEPAEEVALRVGVGRAVDGGALRAASASPPRSARSRSANRSSAAGPSA